MRTAADAVGEIRHDPVHDEGALPLGVLGPRSTVPGNSIVCRTRPRATSLPIDTFPLKEYIESAAHHFLSRGIGQRPAVNQVPRITPKREEVNDGRVNSTGPGWPAELRAGF